jgi:hypothetical protein
MLSTKRMFQLFNSCQNQLVDGQIAAWTGAAARADRSTPSAWIPARAAR